MSTRGRWRQPWAELRSWLRAMTQRRRLEDEMEAELAAHREQLIDDLIGRGLSRGEAQRQAGIQMGSLLTAKEEMRGSLGLGWWDALHADLRYALRLLRKSPGFTAIAVLSLALAIGANTTIFSVAKQLLYDRLDVPDASQLRLLRWTGDKNVVVHSSWGDWDKDETSGRQTSSVFSYPIYRQLQAQNPEIFAFKRSQVNILVHGEARRVSAELVSGNYYAQLGVRPALGRGILPADDAKPEAGNVAVISYGLWQRSFGRSASVLGQTIRVNNTLMTIVGVNPRHFTGVHDVQVAADVMTPLSMQPLVSPMPGVTAPISDNNLWWVNMMLRIPPGTSARATEVRLNTQLVTAVRATMTVKKGGTLPWLYLHDGSRGLFEEQGRFGKPLTVLMAMVGLVLLLACANIANLMLARGAQRQREMSVRLALGAGRLRILRQMLVESLALAAMGGAGGLLLGYFGRNAVPHMMQSAWDETSIAVHFDWWVFVFTAAVTMATGILFGLAPAVAAAREDMGHGLKTAATTATRRRKGLGSRALVGFQFALSTVLVIGAGLFVRTLAGLKSVHVGFRTDHLLLAEIDPPETQYKPGEDILLHEKMAQAFSAVPGVESVTQGVVPYISGGAWTTDFTPEGAGKDAPHYDEFFNGVGNSFFQTMEIPIVAGRGFGPQDTATSLKVGIINQSLARLAFPGENPIGKRFATSDRDVNGTSVKLWHTIVGVCVDTHYTRLRDTPPPQYFLPYVQGKRIGGMIYEIRTRVKPELVVPGLRRAAHAVAPDLPLSDVHTQQQQIDADMQQERTFVVLTSGFGLLALALASVGIYGIMAYSVAQRTNEIGVRLAVGAQPWQVRGLILRESTLLAVTGILCGTAVALVLTRLVRAMLYGIRPDDPLSMTAAVLLLLFVALAASWIPARRAARMDPMEALRHE